VAWPWPCAVDRHRRSRVGQISARCGGETRPARRLPPLVRRSGRCLAARCSSSRPAWMACASRGSCSAATATGRRGVDRAPGQRRRVLGRRPRGSDRLALLTSHFPLRARGEPARNGSGPANVSNGRNSASRAHQPDSTRPGRSFGRFRLTQHWPTVGIGEPGRRAGYPGRSWRDRSEAGDGDGQQVGIGGTLTAYQGPKPARTTPRMDKQVKIMAAVPAARSRGW